MSTADEYSQHSDTDRSETVPSQTRSDAARSQAFLRPLAPKPQAAPRQQRHLVVRSSVPRRINPGICLVCARRGCQLPTHKALVAQTRPTAAGIHHADSRSMEAVQAERVRKLTYTKSYAYFYAQAYVDRDIHPYFDLPIPEGLNKQEMCMLFHDYFTIESNRVINVPRPRELPSELVMSPFLLPAIADSALCLAVLAVSAAALPLRSGRPAKSVTVLTLVDHAMYHLRERLNSGVGQVSDTTVAAATFLWAINSLINDPGAMRQHSVSVHALVAGRGGMANLGLGGAVARLVQLIDVLNAILFAEEPSYENTEELVPLQNPPAPMYGSYFHGKQAQRDLDPSIVQLCLDNCRLVEVVEKMILSGSTTQEYIHSVSQLSIVGTRTAIIYFGLRDTGSRDECVCLAGQLLTMLIYYATREQQMMVTIQAKRLIQALQQQAIPTFWADELDLFIWMLFILAMIPLEFEGKEWAIDVLCQALCSKFGAERWPANWQGQVQRSMVQLVWSNVRLSESFNTICRSVGHRVFPHDDNG